MRRIIVAILICGTLDILSAFAFAAPRGIGPVTVLQSVASGPFGDSIFKLGLWGAAAGLLTHFLLMAIMVGVLAAALPGLPWRLADRPLIVGTAYGLLLYGMMYWVVLPVRWPDLFPQMGWWQVGNALFSHIACVGIPMTFVLCRFAK